MFSLASNVPSPSTLTPCACPCLPASLGENPLTPVRGGPQSDLDALRSRVKAQGEKIRILKRDGAAAEEITGEVATLTILKEELKKAAELAEVSPLFALHHSLDTARMLRVVVVVVA